MDTTERELIRSQLHQVDLLLRKIDRKARLQVEQAGEIEWAIRQIEELKKPVYELLNRKAGGGPPGGQLAYSIYTPI